MNLVERILKLRGESPESVARREADEAAEKQSQDAVISRGRILSDFKDSEAGAIVLGELVVRRDDARRLALAYKKNTHPAGYDYYVNRYQALDEFLGWLDGEIETGQRTLRQRLQNE